MAYRDWTQILLYISDWLEHGETAKQIAEHLHMEVKEVTRQLRRMKAKGIPVPELKAETHTGRPVGIKEEGKRKTKAPFTGRQKSEEQWAEIRNNVITWLQQNVSREIIAERIGIHVQSLSNRLYRWRKEGYPVPTAPRLPRKEVTVRLQRKQQTEANKRARELRREEKKRKWTETQASVYRPARKVEKRLPDRHRDTSAMKFVRVNDKTLIQIPLDRDEQEAITEWKSRHNKYK
jgi:DNA-binding Lrp family transcriptional regulator